LTPTLRAIARVQLASGLKVFDMIAGLRPPVDHAGVPMLAPVLTAPRIFEPELCQQLITFYQAQGGVTSRVMRDVNGMTIGVLDGFKWRRDAMIEDPALQNELMSCIRTRLTPAIERVFQFQATRLERYLVAATTPTTEATSARTGTTRPPARRTGGSRSRSTSTPSNLPAATCGFRNSARAPIALPQAGRWSSAAACSTRPRR
jgi:hypothetical protein